MKTASFLKEPKAAAQTLQHIDLAQVFLVHKVCRYCPGPVLFEVGRLNLPRCAVADVEHLDMFLSFQDAIYHTINMRFVAVKKVSQPVTLSRQRTSIGVLFQAENGFFQSPIPFQGCGGMLGINLSIKVGKIALSA